MKTGAYPPINQVPPKAGETTRVVQRLPQNQVSQEAIVSKVKPTLQDDQAAGEVAQLSQAVTQLGEKSVDAVKGLDPERVQRLLEDD